MKIAIATDKNGNISQHFGRADYFVIYEIENNKIKSKHIHYYRKQIYRA